MNANEKPARAVVEGRALQVCAVSIHIRRPSGLILRRSAVSNFPRASQAKFDFPFLSRKVGSSAGTNKTWPEFFKRASGCHEMKLITKRGYDTSLETRRNLSPKSRERNTFFGSLFPEIQQRFGKSWRTGTLRLNFLQ